MFAVDTSTLIAFFTGLSGPDISILVSALKQKSVYIPPVVLTEILSDPGLSFGTKKVLRSIPLLMIETGYWERAAENRSKLLARNLRARLADTLIAQSCIDHNATLITRDSDFRHFQKYCGLTLG